MIDYIDPLPGAILSPLSGVDEVARQKRAGEQPKVVVTFRAPPELKRRLTDFAAQESERLSMPGLSSSDVINSLLLKALYLAERGQLPEIPGDKD